MNILSAEQDNIDMLLTQMGANVKSIHGLVCFVRFNINETEIFYVYNINAKDQYYLQKVLPYPVGAGVFTKPSEIVSYIKKDLSYYKTASKSTIFKDFVGTNLELHKTIHKMEETFLNYNVPHEKMEEVMVMINQINDILNHVQENGTPIK
ncbi:MAG TPA: hypothetical protein VHP81_00370 [Lachnospiraceae bacterium]|nr:hypothetical protein [Lachnospiraceae bacterium]